MLGRMYWFSRCRDGRQTFRGMHVENLSLTVHICSFLTCKRDPTFQAGCYCGRFSHFAEFHNFEESVIQADRTMRVGYQAPLPNIGERCLALGHLRGRAPRKHGSAKIRRMVSWALERRKGRFIVGMAECMGLVGLGHRE